MSPKQKKIAAKAPPPDKIDAKDFAVLKAEKAKGRGMGLQDESIKPGKVIKAKRGHFSESNISGHKRVMGVLPTIDKVTPTVKGKQLPVAKNILKAAKATRYGKIALGIAGAALGAKELLKSKMKKEDKKMVGGMAKKYSVGGGADMGDPKKPTAVPKGKDSEVMVHDMKGERPLAAPRRRRNFVGSKPDKARRYAATPGYLPKPAIGKMGGGSVKKYSVGGGLDMGGPKGKLMAYAKENLIKDKDKLTLRDKAMIKTVMNMDKSEYPAAERYYKKLTSTKKMGGGMMNKPMGYKSGTMVKARGCKLGRTRPTKMY